ncbi:hypothetical protein CEE36_03680 [candidate division TA06 bacterium B3_TA06]|uniref:Uncharacterized protein n=1 Tax=candidate division TA06 bacterium B3_TA06 TaxID=2012487 RepID=A0A532V8G5_UNCT6|nr:MAG: hypothetical protein CEE36_03680 [candidate division TA06 bacterium B3_TA06]
MAEDWQEKVNELYKQGKHEEVQEILKEAAAVNPQTSEDYVKRGTALSFLGRREEAMVDFEKAIELDPRNAEAHMRRGDIALCSGKPQEALAECDEAIRLAPDCQDTCHSKGNALIALGRYEEAVTYYQKLVKRLPDYKDFWELNRSWVLNELNRHVEALDILKTIDPSNIRPLPSYAYYLHLAGTLTLLARYEEALGALEEGMERIRSEEGCVPCFVGNCWRTPHLEPLRNPPYRKRFEGIVGSPPNT